MKGQLLQRGARLLAASVAVAGTGLVGGCLNRPIEPVEPRSTATVVVPFTQSAVDKIDLLLMIDNSRSMADKQLILAAAVPDLVRGLVNPKCIDPKTGNVAINQPAGPTENCPDAETKRDFNPVLDIHIGIISSSIGGHGSDACPNVETVTCPGNAANASNNDKGHLITRQDACAGGAVPTYQTQGFLAWDPKGKLEPKGEANIGTINIDVNTGAVTTGMPGLVPTLKDLVIGTGQIGCGYEAQLESWYRFLIDPDPYDTISVVAGKTTPAGLDAELIQQRKDFLRPSSLLAIIMLTDENDCSIKEFGQFYFAAQQRDPNNNQKNFYLPKSRAACQTDPNDKCCVSCGQTPPAGCPQTDPACGTHDNKTDDVNLRCFDQKRRFGIDFLYPIDRYTNGLTSPTVPNRAGEMVKNPIFSDLVPSDGDSNIRDASLVFLAGIVGVPWQDIARDPTNLANPDPKKKGFKSASELGTADASGHTTWDYIIGDPANYKKPLDPHMEESVGPRTGTNPITGTQIAPTTAAAGTNPINGHEYTVGTIDGVQIAQDDLQYACIFDLPEPRDCSVGLISCDCNDPKNDNPLCEPDPSKGGNRTLQKRAKGYPGIRELSVLKSIGSQGIVASICPAQLTNLEADDFGYRPAIGSIIDRLKLALGGQCLPRQLTPDKEGQVQCLILEARNTGGVAGGDKCDAFCKGLPARQPVSADHKPAVEGARRPRSVRTRAGTASARSSSSTTATRRTRTTTSSTPARSRRAIRRCSTARRSRAGATSTSRPASATRTCSTSARRPRSTRSASSATATRRREPRCS